MEAIEKHILMKDGKEYDGKKGNVNASKKGQ